MSTVRASSATSSRSPRDIGDRSDDPPVTIERKRRPYGHSNSSVSSNRSPSPVPTVIPRHPPAPKVDSVPDEDGVRNAKGSSVAESRPSPPASLCGGYADSIAPSDSYSVRRCWTNDGPTEQPCGGVDGGDYLAPSVAGESSFQATARPLQQAQPTTSNSNPPTVIAQSEAASGTERLESTVASDQVQLSASGASAPFSTFRRNFHQAYENVYGGREDQDRGVGSSSPVSIAPSQATTLTERWNSTVVSGEGRGTTSEVRRPSTVLRDALSQAYRNVYEREQARREEEGEGQGL